MKNLTMKSTANKLLVVGAFLLASGASQAGSAVAQFSCKSASGRTTVQVGDDDFTSSLAYARITVDDKTLEYDLESNLSELHSVYDFKNKVITQIVLNRGTHKQIRLWAIPSTVKITQADSVIQGTFTAKLEGNDPRVADDFAFLPLIEVKCTVSYSI